MRTESTQTTVLYLIRHGATEANLARPARLQGRKNNPPLAQIGIHQAELTCEALRNCEIHHCYASPMLRAMETAQIITAPHDLKPKAVEEITECDVGRWEGMDWQAIRYLEAEAYARFMMNPAENGYPQGESFADVHARVAPALESLLCKHVGESILVIAHHVVNRTYLANLMGLPLSRAREVKLENCGISVVKLQDGLTSVTTLDSTEHLYQPMRAAA